MITEATEARKTITQGEAERRLLALRPAMVKRARRSLKLQDAEDVVQAASYYCWEVAESLYDDAEGEAGFTAWAMSVLLRRVRTACSRRAATRGRKCPLWEECDGEYATYEDMEKGSFVERHTYTVEGDILDQIERDAEREEVYSLMALSDLSERQAQVVGMVMGGYSTGEIAAQVGISVKNVNAHLSAAKTKMIAARAAREREEI